MRPGFSRADPTWYQTFTATVGTLWSSCRITVSPFGSVNIVYGTEIFGPAAGLLRRRGGNRESDGQSER